MDENKTPKTRAELEAEQIKKLDRSCKAAVAFLKQATTKAPGRPQKRRGKSK